MTPPQGKPSQTPRPKSQTPAERGEELAEAQRRLKMEAAERRQRVSPQPRPAGGKTRGRG